METTNSYDACIGRDAYDVNGDKIGSIDAIYYDNQTGRPEWLPEQIIEQNKARKFITELDSRNFD